MYASIRWILAGLAIMFVGAPAHAQTMWLDHDARSCVRFERFAATSDVFIERGATYTLVATARAPVGRTAWLVAEMPYAHGNLESASYADEPAFLGGGTVGNIYVGAEIARHPSGPRFEAGTRLPLAQRTAPGGLYAGYSSGVERAQAFLERSASVRLGVFLHRRANARIPIGYDVGVAPTWQIPTHGPEFPRDVYFDDDPLNLFSGSRPLGTWHALFVDESANVRWEGPHARFGIGFAMRWLASRGGGDFAANSASELSFALELQRGPIHPGVVLGLPLDNEQKSYASRVVGITLSTVSGSKDGWRAAGR
jgi:hypothetical protein